MRRLINWFLIIWVSRIRRNWSAFRHRGQRNMMLVEKQHKFDEDLSLKENIQALAKKVYKKYNYKYDGFSTLFDSMRSPAQCYNDFTLGLLEDDCDGFHACMYHIINQHPTTIVCSLVTILTRPLKHSHTVLYMRTVSGNEYLLDYTKLFTGPDILSKYVDKKYNSRGIKILSVTEDRWDVIKQKYNTTYEVKDYLYLWK